MAIDAQVNDWSWWNAVIVAVLYALPLATVLWVMLSVVRRTKLSADNTSQLVAQQQRIIQLLEESATLQAETNRLLKGSAGKGGG